MANAKKQIAEEPEWVPLTDELDWDDVGGRLLANIARGMYSPQGVLREYVQNAADAYKDLETPSEEHKIIITPGKNSLSIQDTGVGMDDKGSARRRSTSCRRFPSHRASEAAIFTRIHEFRSLAYSVLCQCKQLPMRFDVVVPFRLPVGDLGRALFPAPVR
jgi:hypothetical protein